MTQALAGDIEALAGDIEKLAAAKLQFVASPLMWWAIRNAGDLRRAIDVLPGLLAAISPNISEWERSIKEWFGVRGDDHPFYQSVESWLGLTETQVMSGLQYYLCKYGDPATKAFLRAAAPGIVWPDELDQWDVVIEEPVYRRGSSKGGPDRIDMIIAAGAYKGFGVVIEAKFGSGISKNPLARYEGHASSKWNLRKESARFLVLGRRRIARTTKVLEKEKNKRWEFLSWHVFLTRFERELEFLTVDQKFAELRRQIWRCV